MMKGICLRVRIGSAEWTQTTAKAATRITWRRILIFAPSVQLRVPLKNGLESAWSSALESLCSLRGADAGGATCSRTLIPYAH